MVFLFLVIDKSWFNLQEHKAPVYCVDNDEDNWKDDPAVVVGPECIKIVQGWSDFVFQMMLKMLVLDWKRKL